MATAKRDFTDPRVQGPRPNVDRAPEERQTDGHPEGTALRLAAAELVRHSRTRQGLPARIEDPSVISRIVALLQPMIDD